MMGFEDSFKLVGAKGKLYNRIGNSIVVPMVEEIAQQIKKQVFNNASKVQPPKKYKVIYHNDDYTPMELVVISLIAIFHRSQPDAFKIMMHVHEKGKGIAQGGLSKEIAETKTNRVVQWFREQGYPLLATFEPEE